jgi:hypothetical protein
MRGCTAAFVLLACLLPAQGQSGPASPDFQYRFGGYFKSLLTASHSFFTGDAYGDSLNRLRLTFDGGWRHSVLVHVDYDNEVHFGDLIQEPDFDLVRHRQDGAYFDLLHTIVDEKHVYWDTSLYRGYLTLRRNNMELTLGRQRIAWGTAHFWSPADVFNPISPLQVESDERQGVDAAQLAVQLPQNLRWSLVYAPGDGIGRSTEATRLATTVHNFDVAVEGGHFRQDWLAGGDFAGQWGGAGLRGELTYTWRGTSAQPDALRWTFGSDYAINSKWYVLAEYFYNQGQPAGIQPGQPVDPSVLLRYTNEIFTLRRHFLSAGARYTVTPLLNVETYTVIDLQGPSVLFLPVATYNLTANTDLTVGGQIFASGPAGEFEHVPNLFYAEYAIHF